mgnify:CR=1 FL=1
MPLYEQLYNALAQDIRSGALQPGKALPGRRTMAAQLGISTNTVDTAYQMLAAEGLAVTRPRSGLFCSGNRRHAAHPPAAQRGSRPKSHAKKIQSAIKTIFYTICQPAV